ncbi:MAG: helix-turn-helix domain-containing protein [Propionibacteriales bacterium]|nr:helix-turn-helix domain-containing protein [Propionibacteriales bacterium]
MPTKPAKSKTVSGVQSIERAFEILELMAEADGTVGLSQLADSSGLPLPTIHRLMRTLVAKGYVRQEPSRRYALGPRLIVLGEGASRLLGRWARPYLAELVDAVGETANMAVFDGDEIVYIAQVPSKHSMRMFTEVGRRVLPHCTAVGKVLLAQLPESSVREILARTGMPAQTDHTMTDQGTLLPQLDVIRQQGYAVDDGEQEVGVRCIAVPVVDAPSMTAISISGPAARVSKEVFATVIPALRKAAESLSKELSHGGPTT